MNRCVKVVIGFWMCLIAASLNGAEPSKKTAAATSVTELHVRPRAIEKPLMKYRLMPAQFELREGNAAPILLRFPWEQTAYFAKTVPTFSDYLELPLTDPKLRNANDVFPPSFYRELKRAAYRKTADWEYPIGEQPFIRILLPDIQGSRAITGRGLSVWIRNRIANGKLDEAREGILVGLAVSRHYARGPFVITQLVSAAIDSIMLSRLEELLSQPECPNLYWALTALPDPLLELRPSIELEQRSLEMTLPALADIERLRSPAEWSQAMDQLLDLILDPGVYGQIAPSKRDAVFKSLVQRGRAELPTWIGGDTARVTAMSDAEAGIRWFMHFYREQAEQIAAFMCLKPMAAIPRLRTVQEELLASIKAAGLPSCAVLEKPLNVYVSIHRQRRRVDALRIVEALRDYAASHESRLPDSLSKIAEPPIPNDAFSDTPFHYELSGNTATISAPGVSADGEDRGAIHYRVTLEK